MKRANVLLLFILGLFLAFQLLLALNVRIAQYDEAIFLDVARNIQKSGLPLRSVGAGKFFFDHTPLYIYMLGGLMTFTGENVLLLRLATLFFAVGSLVLVYRIGLEARSAAAGLVAAALLALNPFFAVYAFFIRMEAPFVFFLLLAIHFLLQVERRPERAARFWLLAGLATAAAVLSKEIGLAFWAAAGLYVLWQAKTWRARATAVALVMGPTVLFFAAWLIYAWVLDADRLLETLGRWTGAWQTGGSPISPRYGTANLNWLRLVGNMVLGWPLAALLAVALVTAAVTWRRQHPPRLAALLLLYLLLALGASLVMNLKEARHVIGLIPVAALLIGLLVDWEGLWRWARQRPYRLALTIVAIFIFAWAISPLQLAARDSWAQPTAWFEGQFAARAFENDASLAPLEAAGHYLRAQAAPDEVIIVVRQGPVVGFYAQRPYMFMYTRPFAENMALLQEAEFVVFDSSEFWRQSADETAKLRDYLQTNFRVEKTYKNTVQKVTVYRKN